MFTSRIFSNRIISLKYFLLCLSLILTVNVQAQVSSDNNENKAAIRLGVIPHLSTKLLLQKYGPLINYLKEELQRPVIINTAPNFRTFIERVKKGEFDIYLTAPTMAAYHEKHNNHWRLAKFSQKIQGAIIVADKSSYEKVADLKGKTVAAPDILAVVTALGEITLKENGILPDKDVNMIYTPSHNNSLQSVAEDKAEGAIVGYNIYRVISSRAKLRQPLRVLEKTRQIPHMMFMSPAHVSELEMEQFKTALLKFTAKGKGKEFFANIPFINIEAITDEDMKSLEGLLEILEQRLKQ